MISATSRYASASVDIVTSDRGKHQSVNVPTPQDRSFAFTFYQVRDGDTVDYLAHFILGDGTLWWMLADANPEILDWSVLPVGTILRIPNV
jgi:phage tail protein X